MSKYSNKIEREPMSEELYNYLYNNPKYRIETSVRAYDGKINVWRPYIDLQNDNTHSVSWENIGVFNTETEAVDYIREFLNS